MSKNDGICERYWETDLTDETMGVRQGCGIRFNLFIGDNTCTGSGWHHSPDTDDWK